LLYPSNDREFFWQVIPGPAYITQNTSFDHLQNLLTMDPLYIYKVENLYFSSGSLLKQHTFVRQRPFLSPTDWTTSIMKLRKFYLKTTYKITIYIMYNISKYRASHIRLISEFILYATKNTNDADHLIPFIMRFNLGINVGM
jgi:hypothetical protein